MITPDRDSQALKRYFCWFFVATIAGMSLVAAFNALIDPLGVSPLRIGIPNLNLHKPLRANFDRLAKPYDVRTQKPKTLFVGSSLVKQAIDPRDLAGSAFAPAYNAGIDNGANFQETKRMLEYYFAADPNIRTVFIEVFLTAVFQFGRAPPAPAVTFWDLQKERALALVSGSAFEYSMETIRFNRAATAPPSVPFYTGFIPIAAPSFRASVDNIPDQLYRNRIVDPPPKLSKTPVILARQIIALCYEHHIDCRFFISPLHADVLYGLYFAGLWNDLVWIKRAFAQLAPTYDFTRYNELIDERSGPLDLWWEAFHFSPTLGADMVRVMTSDRSSNLPVNFGTLLSPLNVDAEMEAWTQERDQWIARYPLIHARFDAARINNQVAIDYTGLLNTRTRQLIVNGQTYRIVARQGGSIEYVNKVPDYAMGWVGDVGTNRGAKAVLIFQGDKLIGYAEPNVPRPDLSKDSSHPLSYAGFYLPLPALTHAKSAPALSAYALYDDGTAAELQYAPGASGFGISAPQPSSGSDGRATISWYQRLVNRLIRAEHYGKTNEIPTR